MIFLPGEYIKVSEVRLHETLILALFHVEFCIDGTVAPLEVEPGVFGDQSPTDGGGDALDLVIQPQG